MGSKYTKRYSEEFKRDAIALVASSGRTVTEVARELGISSESLQGWVKKANGAGLAGAGASVAGGRAGETQAAAQPRRRPGQDDRDPERR
ncbi:transposase [Streptomyces mirabilis]